MTDIFLFKLLMSSIVGGIVVTGCTIAAERYGTDVGGVIGGFPSTVTVTLFFIGLVTSPERASEATRLVPVIVGFNGLFLVSFALLVRQGLMPGFAGALLLWCLLSFGVSQLNVFNFRVALAIFFFLFLVSFYLLQYRIPLSSFKGEPIRPTVGRITIRATFSGLMIAMAVFLSKVAGPTIGGIFSVFPAAFISTLLIACSARGCEFARALTRPLLISGMTNVVVYIICVRYFYPLWGLAWGTVGAFAVSGVSACAIYRLIISRSVQSQDDRTRAAVDLLEIEGPSTHIAGSSSRCTSTETCSACSPSPSNVP